MSPWLQARRTPGAWRYLFAAAESAAAVVLVSLVVAALKPTVPVLSLGVLYVFAVLPIALLWGLRFALLTSVASMLTFNFFFLPPVHTFRLAQSANWFALANYVVTAVVVSELAVRARRRAAAAEQRERESALLVELATDVIRGRDLDEEMGEIAAGAARVLGAEDATIVLGAQHRPPQGEVPYPLEAAGRAIGTIYTPESSTPSGDVQRRFLPALAALLAVALDRDRLQREAFEAETLRRSDALKTALLRSVSHDLRSPLTSIAASISALRNRMLNLSDADREDLLETIDLESGRLDRLVADLLDLSRLEAGSAQPAQELWSVDELVRQAVASLGAQDRVDVVAAQPAFVNVDAAQIQRALANLLENALKFSPPNARVQARVNMTRSEAIVRIVDQGPGLAEDELERVFAPFSRGRGAQGPGAGLGLAIARGFAEANGGRVWAESRPGQGATFALALPVAEVPAELPA